MVMGESISYVFRFLLFLDDGWALVVVWILPCYIHLLEIGWHLLLVIFGGTTFEYMWMIANLGHSWYIPFFLSFTTNFPTSLSLWHTICMGNGVGNGIWMGS